MLQLIPSLASGTLALLLSGLALSWTSSANAMWPTTSWAIENNTLTSVDPAFKEKYLSILEYGSQWFASMSFRAPYQINDQGRLTFTGGEKYLAYLNPDRSSPISSHTSKGRMY